MNNADMPVAPITDNEGFVLGASYAFDWADKMACIGLTKREHFAGLAMQGLINDDANMRSTEVARRAVLTADALLAELTREPT
jgi:hypothetical protein